MPSIAWNDGPATSTQEAQKPLADVLRRIESRYKIFFVYNTQTLEGKYVNEPDTYPGNPEELLKSVLRQVNLQYERIGAGNYAIKKIEKKEIERIGDHPTSAMTGIGSQVVAGLVPATNLPISFTRYVDVSVSGTVKDEQGNGLPGVSIALKGTTRGTITDNSGQYKLTVPDASAVLVYSFVGYKQQELTVGSRTVIDVQLQPDDQSLEEVVVVGYGVQKKVNLTGAVSTVDAKALENRPVPNLANALQGITPGLTITRQNGQPGQDNLGIQIRGGNLSQRQR